MPMNSPASALTLNLALLDETTLHYEVDQLRLARQLSLLAPPRKSRAVRKGAVKTKKPPKASSTRLSQDDLRAELSELGFDPALLLAAPKPKRKAKPKPKDTETNANET